MGARGDQRLSAGSRIGAYEIRRFLGRGATANVYECRHRELGRLTALKILHPHLARQEVAAARFLREGRTMARIVHPNVVEVIDVGEHDNTPYLVMSLVDGEDLAEYARRAHPMSMTDIADSILPVISAVAAAHDAGIIHRDLKPSNIRLTRSHRGTLVPKVLDFGISKLTEDDRGPDLTDTFGPLGTASYMAPEQLRSAKSVDARCDVYALGVILYECATGSRPFRGAQGYDLMHAVLTAPVPPPSALRPGIPEAFDAIVTQAMRREPSERFKSARELGVALAPLASDETAWLREFGPRPSEPSIVPSSSGARLSEGSFTLISGTKGQASSRAGIPVSIAAGIACALLVCAMAMLAGRPGRSTRSGAVVPPPRMGPLAASVSETAPERAALSPSPSAPLQNVQLAQTPARDLVPGLETPSAHVNPPRRAAAATPTTHAAPPHEEIGTNGAPIVE
jgi:eukaryotic-like serine/threonine-protein kinase